MVYGGGAAEISCALAVSREADKVRHGAAMQEAMGQAPCPSIPVPLPHPLLSSGVSSDCALDRND